MNPEQLAACEEWCASQKPLNVEIRIEGGYNALRAALRASGQPFCITTHLQLPDAD